MSFNHLCMNCMREIEEGQNVCPHCGFDCRTYVCPPHVLRPFTSLHEKYIIGRMLGAGGFGITYLALDTALDRIVAVKEFFIQQSMYRQTTESSNVTISVSSMQQEKLYEVNRNKFEQEAKTLAKLANMQGIVRVYDFFRENNTSYMVLEYLSGMTLKAYVKKKQGKLSWQEVIHKLTPVMTSLDILHKTVLVPETRNSNNFAKEQIGIIHRDISPDNIMVSAGGQLTLFDFGGAKIQHETKSYVILAKAGYSPIEQVQSGDETGPWTDVYAMAATIYYCLCGHIPLESTRRAAGTDNLVPPSREGIEIAPWQEQVLLKGLALRYKDRYQSMAEFRDALLGKNMQAVPKSEPAPRHFKIAITMAAVSALVLGGTLAVRYIFPPGAGSGGTGMTVSETGGTAADQATEQYSEDGEDIISKFNHGTLTYREAMAEIEKYGSAEDEEVLNQLQSSKEAYEKGEQYAQNDDTIEEALEQYGKVIKKDVNYEEAQNRIWEIQEQIVADCRDVVNALTEAGEYESALGSILNTKKRLPENEALDELWDETALAYSEYALERSQVLVDEGEFDAARSILDDAYDATEDQKLLDKVFEVEEAESVQQESQSEEGIHQYDFYHYDGSWEEALDVCAQKGGYLVHINSDEELDYLVQGLDAFSLRDTRFYVGARRELNDTKYYWADAENTLYGDEIDIGSWWKEGEPSFYTKFEDVSNEEQVVERVVELYYDVTKEQWQLNDIPVDLNQYISNQEKRIGFICEIEDVASSSGTTVSSEQYIGSIGGGFGLPEAETPSAASEGTYESKWYVITSEYEEGIAVRSGPDKKEELLCRIPYGTFFLVDAVDGVWGHTTVNGYTGWVHLDYAKPIDELGETGWYQISSDYEAGIAVRMEPSQEAFLLCRIPYGTSFFVDETDGAWGHTTVNGYTGWIHLDYAEKME